MYMLQNVRYTLDTFKLHIITLYDDIYGATNSYANLQWEYINILNPVMCVYICRQSNFQTALLSLCSIIKFMN